MTFFLFLARDMPALGINTVPVDPVGRCYRVFARHRTGGGCNNARVIAVHATVVAEGLRRALDVPGGESPAGDAPRGCFCPKLRR